MNSIQALLYLQQLRKSQWLDIRTLEKRQLSLLQFVTADAYENVPYYREHFDRAGVKPYHIKTLDDLEKIPITTRKQLQNQPPENVVSKRIGLNRCKKITTAGSSGMPLPVYRTASDIRYIDMPWARASIENGRKLTDKTVYFKYNMPPGNWFEYLGIWKKHIISLHEKSEYQIAELLRFQPDIIRGYPFNLVLLSRILQRKKIEGIRPKLIFCMGSLLDDDARKSITSAFGAKVIDLYGATETGCIAWECPKQEGYHVNTDAMVIEIVKEGKRVQPGQRGKVVCTSLQPLAMPFIRYDLGDVAVFSKRKCSCGRGLPLLEKLEGRADDFFVSADGSLRTTGEIVDKIKRISGLMHFRITQHKTDQFEALILPDQNYSQSTDKNLIEILESIMGHKVHVRIEVREEMPKDPAGKIRSLISHVQGRW